MVGAYFKETTEQHHTAGPSLEPPQDKGKEVDHVIAGEEIWRQMLKVRGKPGKNWRKQRRTESYGDNLLAAKERYM